MPWMMKQSACDAKMRNSKYDYNSEDFIPERVHRASEVLMNLSGIEPGHLEIKEFKGYMSLELEDSVIFKLFKIIDERLKQGLAYLPNPERANNLVWHSDSVPNPCYSSLRKLSDEELLYLLEICSYLLLSCSMIYDWIGVEMFQRWEYYPHSFKVPRNTLLEEIVEKNPQFKCALTIRNNFYYLSHPAYDGGLRSKKIFRPLEIPYFSF
jgi:hypothetical protein